MARFIRAIIPILALIALAASVVVGYVAFRWSENRCIREFAAWVERNDGKIIFETDRPVDLIWLRKRNVSAVLLQRELLMPEGQLPLDADAIAVLKTLEQLRHLDLAYTNIDDETSGCAQPLVYPAKRCVTYEAA